ncbi:hypothetical protein HCT53_04920 [Spirochaetales bacterium BR151]|nr:hypothetical protein [Entomospira culicis]NIZ19338.1 hypothetical protein [Entomospira culicis]WDI36868.1 hypothetical protein PVA46_05955 [Entomospira culicis]
MGREIADALDSMILSASGWRKIFTEDREEESLDPSINEVDGWIAYVAGIAFSRYLKEINAEASPRVLLARDTRPTGGALVSHVTLGLSSQEVEYAYIGIVTLPEVLAYVRASGEYDAFFYVSASHNPVGYNGFKFGLADGGVLGGEASVRVITIFRALLAEEFAYLCPLESTPILADSALKLRASQSYRESLVGSLLNLENNHIDKLRSAIQQAGGFGVVIDFNGSARINSIDQSVLESLGVQVHKMGGQLGQFHHAIVPEGDSLALCQSELERMFQVDPRYQLGIVVDCDGDRGNLVYIDGEGKAQVMDAQTTFSLSVLAMLAYTAMRPSEQEISIVVNDATSLRIEDICDRFGVTCHRSETGEANVLAQATHLRHCHHLVPIAGEGSNGGTIIHPSTVRDPLTTLLALINLLFMEHDGTTLMHYAQKRLGVAPSYWTIADILAHLPAYQTTSVVAPEALVKTTSTPYELKRAYVELLASVWAQWQAEHPRDRLSHYKIFHYEGREDFPVLQAPALGGMRIHLYDVDGELVVAFWLRGSKTEPMLRLMVDTKREPLVENEAKWRKLHRDLIERADAHAQRG